MPDVAEKKHPCLFKKGQSGNPNGRPKGIRNKATMAAQELLDGEAEALTRKAIEKAMEGDMTALKLCLERISSTAQREGYFNRPSCGRKRIFHDQIAGSSNKWRTHCHRSARAFEAYRRPGNRAKIDSH